MYTIRFTKTAEKAFDLLQKSNPSTGLKIAVAIEVLARNPSVGLQLRGNFKGQYKLRVGAYRIIYTTQHQILLITVLDIGHRREVYR